MIIMIESLKKKTYWDTKNYWLSKESFIFIYIRPNNMLDQKISQEFRLKK